MKRNAQYEEGEGILYQAGIGDYTQVHLFDKENAGKHFKRVFLEIIFFFLLARSMK